MGKLPHLHTVNATKLQKGGQKIAFSTLNRTDYQQHHQRESYMFRIILGSREYNSVDGDIAL